MSDTIVQIETNDTIIINDTDIQVLSFGVQGPKGDAGDIGSGVWGAITGTITNQVDLTSALSGKASTVHSHDYSLTYAPYVHDHNGTYSLIGHDHTDLAPKVGASLTNVNQISYDTTPDAPIYAAGNTFWSPDDSTINIQTGLGDTTLQVGQESYVKVLNTTGSTILNGNVVYINGAASGRPTIALANAASAATSDAILGMATHDITNGTHGFIVTFGVVHDLDTSAWPSGTTVYLSAGTSGAVTSTQPLSPNYVTHVGHVIESNATTGSIYVNIDTITQTANSVRIDSGVGVQEMNNVQDFFRHAWSSGITDGCLITDNGDGTVNISSGEVLIRDIAEDDADLKSLVISSTTNLALIDNEVNYLYINYNGGALVWNVGTSISDFDGLTKVIGYAVGRNGLTLNVVDLRKINVDFGRKGRRQKVEADGYIYSGWHRSTLARSTLGSSGLNVTVGAGKYYYFDNPFSQSAFDTSIAGTALPNVFRYFYNRTGNWTQIAQQKTINNTQYDNAGTLVTLGNNKFRTDWVFMVMCGVAPYLAVIMGDDEYGSLSAAQAAPHPNTLPPQFEGIGVLIGQIVVEKSLTTLNVQQAGSATFALSAGASNHNDTANIQGGTSGEYYHLTSAEYAALGVGGGGWTSVLDWSHTVNLASFVVPIEDGAYEMYLRCFHLQSGEQLQLLFSTDAGSTVATLSNVRATTLTANPFGGPSASSAGQAVTSGIKLMGGYNLPGFTRIKMLVMNGGKNISIQEWSLPAGSNAWGWTTQAEIEHTATLNAFKLLTTAGNFLTGSFFKVWKVS
jgi:hypothetical protein